MMSPQKSIPFKKISMTGRALLEDPIHNKGTAFSYKERRELNLHGLLPPVLEDLQTQAERVMWNMRRITDNLEKYSYIMNVADVNMQLFYYCIAENIPELMPVVYTPTVGLACQKFGAVFQMPRGMFVTIKDVGRVYSMLMNWPNDNVKAICFTDGERILGLGDLGAQGMGIPIGKLALYTACAGINPDCLLPVTLDVGCNTQAVRDAPYYIGLKQERDRSEKYDQLVEEFMLAAQRRWGPSVLIQFEDFGNRNAFRLLKKHQNRFNTFNDDIQGTASVALAGVYTACRMTKTKISEHRFCFMGAGSAGLGIAGMICTAMVEDDGITMEDARKKIFLVDSRGLVVKGRSTGGISTEKEPYAQEGFKEVKDLAEIVALVKATCIMGVSGQPKVFTKEVCQNMAKNIKEPMIFPMSNPTKKAECTAADAFAWTDGKCIFASGSPFPELMVNGQKIVPAQGNNAYVFPGVALALIATKALRCPDNFFVLGAKVLAGLVTDDMMKSKSLYPPLSDLQRISFEIAVKVAEECYKVGYATAIEPKNVRDLVRSVVWDHTTYPNYSSNDQTNLTEEFTGRPSVMGGI